MIIFRVTTGRSFTQFPSTKDGVASNPLRFAHQTAESSFLHSTLSRGFGGNDDPENGRGASASLRLPTQNQTSIIELTQEKPIDSDSEVADKVA